MKCVWQNCNAIAWISYYTSVTIGYGAKTLWSNVRNQKLFTYSEKVTLKAEKCIYNAVLGVI